MNWNVRQYVVFNVQLVLQNWIVLSRVLARIVISTQVSKVTELRVIQTTMDLQITNFVLILKLDREYL